MGGSGEKMCLAVACSGGFPDGPGQSLWLLEAQAVL